DPAAHGAGAGADGVRVRRAAHRAAAGARQPGGAPGDGGLRGRRQPPVSTGVSVVRADASARLTGASVALADAPARLTGVSVALADASARLTGASVALADAPATLTGPPVARRHMFFVWSDVQFGSLQTPQLAPPLNIVHATWSSARKHRHHAV